MPLTHLSTLVHTGVIPLKDLVSTQIRDTQAFSGVSREFLQQTETLWQPLCERLGLEDSHWRWAEWKYYVAYQAGPASYAYSIAYDGVIQGLILVQNQWSMSHVSERGRPAIYVAYVGAAPWNRRKSRNHPDWSQVDPLYHSSPYFAGVGKSLITIAMSLSEHLGYGGRLALHATKDALEFYLGKCHFIETPGPASEPELIYLELTTVGVRRFRGVTP